MNSMPFRQLKSFLKILIGVQYESSKTQKITIAECQRLVLLVCRGKRLLCYGLSMEAELGNFGLFF